ncbi:hypothetical protein L5515_004154 [Caenorhabditis briggsae]|nr:hypothetical protein L3Y34_001295 [Caenorhabditis briggsae]UMM23430.1 hypothetical protein L5515_004154 [Caenorhabditis briggsae]
MKNRKKPIHLSVTEETTVEDIMKKVIESLAGDASIPSLSKMKAMFDDEYCENSQTCKDLGLEDADCIDIYY